MKWIGWVAWVVRGVVRHRPPGTAARLTTNGGGLGVGCPEEAGLKPAPTKDDGEEGVGGDGSLGGEDVAYVAGEAGEDIVAVKRVVPGER